MHNLKRAGAGGRPQAGAAEARRDEEQHGGADPPLQAVLRGLPGAARRHVHDDRSAQGTRAHCSHSHACTTLALSVCLTFTGRNGRLHRVGREQQAVQVPHQGARLRPPLRHEPPR